MRTYLKNLTLVLLTFFSLQIIAQNDYKVEEHYTKKEVDIEMRDGVKLHTTIYSPKDTSKEYPILMQRTPYSSKPYGEGQFRSKIGPNQFLMKEGNIIVYQDVRGRWMSEGDYDNMRPFIPNKKGKQTDEASDTYDTIEWLIKNVDNNNGNVGTWGISYPGFYTSYSLLSGHPALKAASPQASISDFFFDDFHHNGAYLLSYFMATALFGNQTEAPTTESWYSFPKLPSKDQYQFFLDHTPISKLDEYYPDNFFWNQLKEHPNYDKFWQDRGLIKHLKEAKIKTAVMYVGGFFDAEDLYGPFQSYKAIEENSKNYNTIVYGPWSHGDWARLSKRQAVGNVYFGDDISENYQKNVETTFFNYFLKEEGKAKKSPLPEAMMFDTGCHEWTSFEAWPPKAAKKKTYYLGENQTLKNTANKDFENKFISDPKKPIPYSEDIKIVFTPRKYMTDDQRFAARRPDVLVFETEVLEEDITMAGEIEAKLKVATTGTDADWVVKIVDVYPADAEDTEEVQNHLKMSNYHMMVRSEVMPARFRNGFEKPEASVPNQKTDIDLTLQGIYHTFKKGHKIQVQVQSSWFPLINLNPQTFVPNIFKAEESDYKKQTHTVFGDSSIEFTVLEK
ncbi:hypothetical protein SAMN04488096_104186 [Mesonia phycicola]|uniref:Xaa-Pro dipeptidyl-peptidase C-terminal domain-containing protein n=1 Tax=Mesonia phycicola TaxID=579105 RepID=A0A1M6DVW1_9FLAO|nr:CocE/NonD family hydrolase [Mesonia phycicola]SHI77168.1 hypothetical protein SAMN04488096_104186 [Mesonia phycicola]